MSDKNESHEVKNIVDLFNSVSLINDEASQHIYDEAYKNFYSKMNGEDLTQFDGWRTNLQNVSTVAFDLGFMAGHCHGAIKSAKPSNVKKYEFIIEKCENLRNKIDDGKFSDLNSIENEKTSIWSEFIKLNPKSMKNNLPKGLDF
ncbi:MAG: hypothetical protein MHMPM18_001435 [Marteilia pararefringens]